MAQKIFGIVGWKNSGKTGLMERLVAEINARGLSVSTIKHAHHSFDVDQPGRDSFRHRSAGAQEVLLCSGNRWALMHELRDQDEPAFEFLLEKLEPVDLVLIEGYKKETHSKIECYRAEVCDEMRARSDDTICAVATDCDVGQLELPLLDLNDTNAIADFILTHQGLM